MNDQHEINRYQQIFATMQEGVVEQDEMGNIIFWNDAAEKILDKTADELRGVNSTDPKWLAIKEDGSEFSGDEHPAMVVLKTGEPVNNVVMGLLYENQPTRWILINSNPFEIGGKLHALTTFINITPLHEAKMKIDEKNQELEKMNKFMVDRELTMAELKHKLDSQESNSTSAEHNND